MWQTRFGASTPSVMLSAESESSTPGGLHVRRGAQLDSSREARGVRRGGAREQGCVEDDSAS